MPRHDNEIRCFCARRPLLGVYGRDADGKLFIHIKVYKQSRLYAEIFVDGDATCRIRCRECLRLQKVKIVSGRPLLQVEREAMDSLAPDPPATDVAPPTHRPVR